MVHQNIFLPVDGDKTNELINCAIKMAIPGFSVVHLAYFQKPSLISIIKKASKSSAPTAAEARGFVRSMIKVLYWKDVINSMQKNLTVRVHIRKCWNRDKEINRLAERLDCDLIIIPQKSRMHSIFGLSAIELARATGSKVMVIENDKIFNYDSHERFLVP